MAHFRNPGQTAAIKRAEVAPAHVRPNKFGAKCVRCGVYVEAGLGSLDKVNGEWQVSHIPPCPEEPAYRGVLEPAPLPVPEGRYTIQFADGTYKTLRVRRQDEDASFKPNVGLIMYLSGSNNDNDYTSFAEFLPGGGVRVWKAHQHDETLREALKVLISSPQAAALAYAQSSGNCARCGRTLTVPSSLHAGYGPECATKVGL